MAKLFTIDAFYFDPPNRIRQCKVFSFMQFECFIFESMKLEKQTLVLFNNFSIMNDIHGEIFISRLGIFLYLWIENNPVLLLLESFKNLWFHVDF